MRSNFSLNKMIQTIVFISILFFTIFLYFDIKNIISTLNTLQKEKIVSIIKAKNDAIASLLKYGFYDELKEELKSLSKKDFIYSVQLQSDKFNLGTSYQKAKKVVMPIVFKNQTLGYLSVYYDDKRLIHQFFEKYFTKFILYLGVFLILFLFMAFYIINKIKKLSLLALKLKDIDFRNNPRIEELDNYFEIRVITDAVNKLLEKVYNFYILEKEKQEKIEYLAYHDSLTALKNRTFLRDKLEDIIEEAKQKSEKIAFIFLDLDNFKFVNDTFGHDVGDNLLLEIAEIIKVNDYSKTALRLGGDEFLIILYDVRSKQDIINFVEYLRSSIFTIKKIDNKFSGVTFSIGISIYPDDSQNFDELIKFADIAMYEAKKDGKNRYFFIQDEMKDEIEKFYLTLNSLKKALKKEDELILYYQPKINITENRVEGVEALIRWKQNGKVLSPFFFIPYAEKGGIITKIDSYVLEYAIKELSKWKNNEYLKNLKIAVNISGYKFREIHFMDEVVELLNKYEVRADKLEIEVTESVSIENLKHTQEVLNSLRELGITIAIDDFGTGYSSLNYLKEIPFDTLKIDQAFIRNLDHKDELEITKMIVAISKMLNKKNVAEGVENRDILNIVKGLGVDIVQGYYFAKPLPENELEEYVKNFKMKKESKE